MKLLQSPFRSSLALLAAGLSISFLFAKDDGYWNLNYTKRLPSCDSCHDGARINGAVHVGLTGPQSITVGQRANYSLKIQSSVGASRNQAGFTISTTSGTLIAGSLSQVRSGMLSHSRDTTRTWNFSFSDVKTGLAEWFTVGLAADGSGRGGDAQGFYGPDYKTPGTPFRIFVNDSQVIPYGNSCEGSGGFAPLLGSATNATRGQTFKVELHNAPPSTLALGALGFSDKTYGPLPLPLPLTALGAPGCELNASLDVIVPTPTSGSGAGNGTATWAWPIPNIASLKGLSIFFTTLVVDTPANKLGLTNSNGLKVTIQ